MDIKPTRAEMLEQATAILRSQPVNFNTGGREAVWWCPFHNDAARSGHSGKPNFSINLDTGEWNCFRCGEGGRTLFSLAHRLGSNWEPPENWRDAKFTPRVKEPTKVNYITEALAAGRNAFLTSPAFEYVTRVRGLKPFTATLYGLGYGQPAPPVSKATWEFAKESRMILGKSETWQWAGSVFYADPLTEPTVINCRYIPEEMLPPNERWFEIHANHHTWGDRVVPLGSWRITGQTRVVIVVEGMFDMLVGAQTIAERGLDTDVVCVYTNGSMIAGPVLKWFREHKEYEYVLLPDQDPAGLGGEDANGKFIKGWLQHLEEAIEDEKRMYVVNPPNGKDPDEAFLDGWWPGV